jgi:hypothetical protein
MHGLAKRPTSGTLAARAGTRPEQPMRCPYCVTEISDQALVCPQCTRELYLFKPLLAKIEQLEQAMGEQAKSAVADAEARIAALEAQMAALKPLTEGGMQVELIEKPAPAASSVDDDEAEADTRAQGYAMGLLQAFLPSFLLLVAAHGVLLFVYDLKPLYLRIATILIPVPFGVLLAIHYRGRFWKSVGVAFATAVCTVWAMLFVTATIDKVPVMPQDAREFREIMEYIASIGLAYTTGIMLGEFLPAFREKGSKPHRVFLLVARAVTPDEEGTLGIEKAAKKIDKMIKAATPAATGAASVYAGIKVFLSSMG